MSDSLRHPTAVPLSHRPLWANYLLAQLEHAFRQSRNYNYLFTTVPSSLAHGNYSVNRWRDVLCLWHKEKLAKSMPSQSPQQALQSQQSDPENKEAPSYVIGKGQREIFQGMTRCCEKAQFIGPL